MKRLANLGSCTLTALLAGACASSGGSGPTPFDDGSSGSGSSSIPALELRGASIRMGTAAELVEIAELEDARLDGNGRLAELLAEGDEAVRLRAAQALGRLPYPERGAEITEALCRGLEDSSASVRAAIAFGLGLRADPLSSGVLLAYRNDPAPEVKEIAYFRQGDAEDLGQRFSTWLETVYTGAPGG